MNIGHNLNKRNDSRAAPVDSYDQDLADESRYDNTRSANTAKTGEKFIF